MTKIILQGESERRKRIHYELSSSEEPIGVGGMGQVYKGFAVNDTTGETRPVAIKCLFDDLPASAYERSRREASIQLRNDNLIEMFGFIETQEMTQTGEVRKHYHVVSELLTGVSLADLLQGVTKDRNGEDFPFAVKLFQDYRNDSPHFAKYIITNVLSGVMALHDAGYIHRDIDPSNIMITTDGHVKLIDFGIAKQMNNLTTGDRSLTVAGSFMGKPEYAAPELALGDLQHQNQTTDIYAIGILLYQCIVGHTPFEGPRHEILEAQIKKKVPLAAVKDKGLQKVIATACEKRQEMRYQTAAQMRAAIEVLNGIKRVGGSEGMGKGLKIGLSAAVAAVIVGIAIFFVIDRKKQQEEAARQEREQIELARRQHIQRLTEEARSLEERAESFLKKAQDEMSENRDECLMDAYSSYEELLSRVTADTLTSFNAGEIRDCLSDIKSRLDSMINLFGQQASELESLGEEDRASAIRAKAEKIKTFTNKTID